MEKDKKHLNPYANFFAMIVTSVVTMYFLMYTNSYQIAEHFWFSETRMFMTMTMAGTMVLIMLMFMRNMYNERKLNIAVVALGILLIAGGIGLVRSQVTVTSVDYMEGMIPHHSIAILTSDRAELKDLRVRELADKIIKAQRKEIMEMQWLINDIRKNGIVENHAEIKNRPVPQFHGSTEMETKN